MELDHLIPNLVHEFLKIQSIGKIPLKQFKEVLRIKVYKKCHSRFHKTWHSLTLEAFLEYMYKVWQISNSPQDFPFLLFSTCSSLLFFIFAMRNFCNWDIAVKLYYEEFLDAKDHSPLRLCVCDGDALSLGWKWWPQSFNYFARDSDH